MKNIFFYVCMYTYTNATEKYFFYSSFMQFNEHCILSSLGACCSQPEMELFVYRNEQLPTTYSVLYIYIVDYCLHR